MTEAVQNRLRLRGEGGVSLGACREVVIEDNRIEENGRNHLYPACGIFVSHVECIDIRGNRIENNGPLRFDRNRAVPYPGIRGAIVLREAISLSVPESPEPDSLGADAGETAMNDTHRLFAGPALAPLLAAVIEAKGRAAARIDANTVRQTIGQALRVFAAGPLMILDNSFTAGASMGPVAAVEVKNYGRPARQRDVGFGVSYAPVIMPDGNTMFCHNRTYLTLATHGIVSQLVASADDILFEGNHSEIFREAGNRLKVNSLVISPTLRASNNRLKEPMSS
jgi:hypothetical protein